MAERQWTAKDGKLQLEGYPIRIIRPGPHDKPWGMEHDGRDTIGTETLEMAKYEGARRADEIDEFEGGGNG